MKKAKIYIPTKTAMQSGYGKQKKWVLEFEKKDSQINPLMGWESSTDTLSELKAIEYAKNNGISFEISEPNKKNFIIKSYADNFTKN